MGLNIFWNDRISSIESEYIHPEFTASSVTDALLPTPSRFLLLSGLHTTGADPIHIFRGKLRPRVNGAAAEVNGFLIAFPKLVPAGAIAVRVRLYANDNWTSEVKDTGFIVISSYFGVPSYDAGLYFAMGDINYGAGGIAALSYKIEIEFYGTPSQDLKIARIMIGNCMFLPDNPKYGSDSQIENDGTLAETVSGRTLTTKARRSHRVWKFVVEEETPYFFGTSSDHLRALSNVFMEAGRSREVGILMSPDPAQLSSVYGQNANINSLYGGWGHIDSEPFISVKDKTDGGIEGVYFSSEFNFRELV